LAYLLVVSLTPIGGRSLEDEAWLPERTKLIQGVQKREMMQIFVGGGMQNLTLAARPPVRFTSACDLSHGEDRVQRLGWKWFHTLA